MALKLETCTDVDMHRIFAIVSSAFGHKQPYRDFYKSVASARFPANLMSRTSSGGNNAQNNRNSKKSIDHSIETL